MEKVFRNHLAKDNEEFTLAEFKQIVPSKNVSLNPVYRLKNGVLHSYNQVSTRGLANSFKGGIEV